MLLKNIKVPPFNSTLMGLIKGVADYYGTGQNDAMLLGGSGHAFMMNIHETLCPSGPYCWNGKPFYELLPNIGITIQENGFFGSDSTSGERGKLEAVLKANLDNGDPCGLVNMEYQLISGYDETGFITSQPWVPKCDFPPKHLTFKSWMEIEKEIHITFFTFKKVTPVAEKTAIIASLHYAQDVFKNSSAHTSAPYATGAAAYDTWIKGVEAGHGSEHGNWWNATVWGECRSFASGYFDEIAKRHASVTTLAENLSINYKSISNKLIQIADKDLEKEPKIELLEEARKLEADCIDKIADIIANL